LIIPTVGRGREQEVQDAIDAYWTAAKQAAAWEPRGAYYHLSYNYSLEHLALDILALDGETWVLMEATGRYHEPVAMVLHEYGIRVSVINPLFIK